MRIVIDIYHPARVHLYKNLYFELKSRGHEILFVASSKDVTIYLLESFGINHVSVGSYGEGFIEKIIRVPLLDMRMYKVVKKFRPDIIIGSIRATHVGKLLDIPVVNFSDDEYDYRFTHRLLDSIVAFSGFKIYGNKIIRLNGFKELAYLHPEYFKPDLSKLICAGVDINEKIFLLRFVGWSAYHDLGKRGFDIDSITHLVQHLEKHGTVYISSELPLPEHLKGYGVPLAPEDLHHLLAFSSLFVGDSQTMTTEAAVLGVPAVRFNSFVGNEDMGNFIELEEDYGLIYNCSEPSLALERAIRLAEDDNALIDWKEKRARLLLEKTNVTRFMVWFIENYPRSKWECLNNRGLGLEL